MTIVLSIGLEIYIFLILKHNKPPDLVTFLRSVNLLQPICEKSREINIYTYIVSIKIIFALTPKLVDTNPILLFSK